MDGLEESQFRRALNNIEEGKGSEVDLRYVLGRASKFLSPLQPDEFSERLSNICNGKYTNADVIMLSIHYFLDGDMMGGQVIRRLLTEEKEANTFSEISQPTGVIDVVDMAIQDYTVGG